MDIKSILSKKPAMPVLIKAPAMLRGQGRASVEIGTAPDEFTYREAAKVVGRAAKLRHLRHGHHRHAVGRHRAEVF
jgi:hypothetical protein